MKHLAYLDDEEINSIIAQAKKYNGGALLFKNLVKSITEVLKDKPDPRDMSVVLTTAPSPRFRLPDSRVPCIMIAGGSGIAPFRGFWQELASSGPPIKGSKHLLILGQRTRKGMMFEEEIHALVREGIIDVEVMFSQDECQLTFSDNEIKYEDAPGQRGYIDKIIEGKDIQFRLAHMIREEGAHLYVCGNGRFARTAQEALDKCLCNIFGQNDGKEELEKMVAEDRMVFDIFTSLRQPKIGDQMSLSELCKCNDFAGVRSSRGEQRLLLVIDGKMVEIEMHEFISSLPPPHVVEIFCQQPFTI